MFLSRFGLKQERFDNLGQWKFCDVANPEWHKLALSWPVREDGERNTVSGSRVYLVQTRRTCTISIPIHIINYSVFHARVLLIQYFQMWNSLLTNIELHLPVDFILVKSLPF